MHFKTGLNTAADWNHVQAPDSPRPKFHSLNFSLSKNWKASFSQKNISGKGGPLSFQVLLWGLFQQVLIFCRKDDFSIVFSFSNLGESLYLSWYYCLSLCLSFSLSLSLSLTHWQWLTIPSGCFVEFQYSFAPLVLVSIFISKRWLLTMQERSYVS